MVETKFTDVSQRPNNHLGKLGLFIMVIGMVILYYDGIRLISIVPLGYQFYEHPEMYVPVISMMMAFVGIGIFIYNFSKGGKVI